MPADLPRRFLAFSAEVTAFSESDLVRTGGARCYLSTVARVVGEEILAELLDVYDRVPRAVGQDRRLRARELERHIFSSAKLGPVARNIVKLWYVGVWYALPLDWTRTFGAGQRDSTFIAFQQTCPDV